MELFDNVRYPGIFFDADVLSFYLRATQYYRQLLESEIEKIKKDPDLWTILGDSVVQSFPVYGELAEYKRLEDHLSKLHKDSIDSQGSVSTTVVHRWLRRVKAVGLLYLEHLQDRRNSFALRSDPSQDTLSMVDQRLVALKENVTIGLFRELEPMPLLVSKPEYRPPSPHSVPASETPLPIIQQLRPIVLDSIQIMNSDLRKRCLDLLAQFQADGQPERLDTVLTEATRILEDRLRRIANAPDGSSGLDLVQFAFGPKNPTLTVSAIPAEQEAIYALFRGFFGFIRNSIHHRLVDDITPTRALQIVAMVDYLLSVAEGARKPETPGHAAS